MSAICRPCDSIIAVCPDLFSGGTIPTPIPTRQRVCNTEQTASCPDGNNPQIVPAGTFCTVILNPTASSIATTQAAMDAQALAQAQSMVTDCAWFDIVWTIDPNINIGGPGDPTLISSVGSGSENHAQVSAVAPVVAVSASRGCQARGDITFHYKPGVVTNHNISGVFTNLESPAGSPGGVFQCSVEIFEGPNFGGLFSIFAESHTGPGAIGVIPFSHDFVSNGGTPKVYRIQLRTSVGSEPIYTHNQTATVTVIALD